MTIINSITGGSGSKDPSLQQKSVTPGNTDQRVTADSGFDALQYVSIEGSSNLVAGNVKYGKDIFGVTGTYETSTSVTYNLPKLLLKLPWSTKSVVSTSKTIYKSIRGADNSSTATCQTGDISGLESWSSVSKWDYAPYTTGTTDSAAYEVVVSSTTGTATGATTLPDGTYRVTVSDGIIWDNLFGVYNLSQRAWLECAGSYNMIVSDKTASISISASKPSSRPVAWSGGSSSLIQLAILVLSAQKVA